MSPLNTVTSQIDRTTLQGYPALRRFLNEAYYADAAGLRRLDPDDVLKLLFRDFYVFLETPPANWYAEFRMEATTIMRLMGQDEEQTEYRLRLSTFVNYGRNLLKSYPDPPQVTPVVPV